MRIKIDITNYEQYVVDYFEGMLEGDVLEAFTAFLLLHPDIATELGELAEADMCLTAPADKAFFKEDLKIRITPAASINEENYESSFALAVGEQPESAAQHAVREFLDLNPALQRDYALYQRTALRHDVATTFDDKASLKRPVPLYEALPATLLRMAAILVIALGAYTVFQFVQDTTYKPRQEEAVFTSLGIDPTPGMPGQSMDGSAFQQQALADATPTHAMQRERIKALPIRPATLVPEPEIVAAREMVAYVPTIPKMPANEPATSLRGSVEELTLAQYVGKRLGIEPEQAPTTKALIREGVNKVISGNEQFAVNTQSADDERNTLHILAGAFEFKRVTYKEN